MKRLMIPTAVLAVIGCAAPAYDPAATSASRHFDFAGIDGRLLTEAEDAWSLLEEALGFTPERAKLVVVRDQEEFDRVAGDAAGAQGVYRRGRILTFPQNDARVIRHEVAHHFAVALVGELSPELNEGIAEVLEGVVRIDGQVRVPVVAAGHLERLLESGVVAFESHPAHRHSHVDYAGAWAVVAFALERERGSLAERLKAIAARPPSAPTAGDVLEMAHRWRPELARILGSGTLDERAAAARVLGRLGDVEALKGAFESEQFPRARIAIAGALARNGDKSALASLRGWMKCGHALAEASRAAGMAFETDHDVDRFVKER